MARSDLQPIFEAVGLPVVLGRWGDDEVAQWPFLEYHRESSNDAIADNRNCRKVDGWAVTIYALDDDMEDFYEHTEALEDALGESNIVYYRSEDVFTGEDTVYATYSFDLPR